MVDKETLIECGWTIRYAPEYFVAYTAFDDSGNIVAIGITAEEAWDDALAVFEARWGGLIVTD